MKAVILVGSCDFGRCPVASRLNRALWPVFGKPALQVLLEQLAHQGIMRIVISCENHSDIIQNSIELPKGLRVSFREETLPRGPAGCIRNAAEPEDELLLIFSANMLSLPPIRELLDKHRRARADMTVFLNPQDNNNFQPEDSQIYLCEPTILSCIPETGFFDLKEGFIPAAVKKGLRICTAHLLSEAGHYRNWAEYSTQLKKRCFSQTQDEIFLSGFSCWSDRPDVLIGSNVRISEKAEIFGPVVIGDDSIIMDDVMIFGPTVIGRNTCLGPESIVEESVLWDHVTTGRRSRIRYSLVDDDMVVPDGCERSNQLVPFSGSKIQRTVNAWRRYKTKKRIQVKVSCFNEAKEVPLTFANYFQNKTEKLIGLLFGLLMLGILIISYWEPTIKSLAKIWLESDEYSSGLLVPFVAVYILWLRRKTLGYSLIIPSLWAFLLLLIAQGIRFFGLYYRFESAERLSFVLSIGAVVIFLLGGQFFKKLLPIFLFLFLMLPLPNRVETYITAPLQVWATVSSVFCLETLGFSVIREGNIININGTLVAVAEACNGLRMLTAFVVVTALVSLTIKRKWIVKSLILVSCIPIGLICNTLRLTVTAIAFTKLDTERWEKVFHDFGGFAMMPVALAITIFELWLLSNVLIKPKNKQEQVIYSKSVS